MVLISTQYTRREDDEDDAMLKFKAPLDEKYRNLAYSDQNTTFRISFQTSQKTLRSLI